MLDSIVDSGLVTSTLYKIDDELKFLIMETYLKDRDLVHRFKYYKERNRERDALAAIGRAKRELEIVSGSETSGSSQGDLYSPEETNPVAATHFEEFVGLLTAFLEICFTALIRPVSKTIFALLSRPDTKYDLGYCLQTMFSFLNVVFIRFITTDQIVMSPLTPQSRNEVSHAFKSGFDFGPDSQFTPPKSSEKKLIDQLHSIQEDESLFSELMVTTNDSDEENSKEWADHILKQQTQDLPPCELLADSLVSGSSPTVPDESQYQVVDTKALETSGSPSNQNDEMLRIFQVLRDGLREYIRQLSAAKADYVVMVRSDFLINYGGKAGCHLRTKMINEYLTMAKNDEELLCYSLSQQLGDMSILEDIRNLIRESDRRRKLYNKRKNIMIDKEKRAASTPINDVIPSPVEVSEKKRKPRIDTKFKGLSVEKIQIGYYNQDKLNAVADLTQILKAEESEQFVVDLRGKSMPLKACLEAIYSPELNFDHSMVYTKIPLNLSFDYSIDLESNRTVAYTESLLSVSSHLASDLNVSNDNFSRILQLRAVVRVYDNDMLVLRRTEQVTGHLLSDNNRMKVNLPLNSKYWSSLLNEYSNGSVGAGKFESLRITHTLYFDEDPSVIRTSPQCSEKD
ncbi:hypothetical protein OGAPHI_005028 [Ogataea philodendri]|uniref:Uncharacterized protein n=1 Tax=Ogataea philodendri TaxID=1378263 RepID=A0A9P8P2J2_9ASCO|nr:uncharacterized protein OGAPHI_005028 [Ogataea philodendri]KAH3663627.1 hypothetical protein OGAPHI_005028 [Ogataea philodendri]